MAPFVEDALRSVKRCMQKDTLAERLRRRPAKPMGSARVGSNPTGVDLSKKTNKPSIVRR